jgi:hypothetical protein
MRMGDNLYACSSDLMTSEAIEKLTVAAISWVDRFYSRFLTFPTAEDIYEKRPTLF